MENLIQNSLEKIFKQKILNLLLFRKNNFSDNPHKLATTGLNIARIDPT